MASLPSAELKSFTLDAYSVLMLMLLPLVTGFLMLRKKVIVHRRHILERKFMKWRHYDISGNPTIVRTDEFLDILSSHGELEYRFERRLTHRDQLENHLARTFGWRLRLEGG